MKQFNWTVVCESVLSEEVQVNLKGHVVPKLSVSACLLRWPQCRFNAASLPQGAPKDNEFLKCHCVEKSPEKQ